ncbi:twin-arginine translocase TatA/TatE family subunit [Arthrobacter sp. RHLT1-20]
MRLEGWHLIIIIVLVLLLCAAPKLPGMARSLGQSMRILESEVREIKKSGTTDAEGNSGPFEGPVAAGPKSTDTESRTADGPGIPAPNRL